MPYDKSETVEVKPGVFRSVRVDVSGKAIWNVPTESGVKYTAGDVVNGKYIPLPKYVDLIENYKPVQARLISDGTPRPKYQFKTMSYQERIRQTVLDRRWRNTFERVTVNFNGDTRLLSWKGNDVGDLSYEGVYYYGVFEGDNFIIRSVAKHYSNSTKPLPVGTAIPAQKMKRRF